MLAFREARDKPARGESVAIECPSFDGASPAVRALAAGLEPLRDRLLDALVHGSVATGEAIAYSDLDAVVVIRDRVFERRGLLADTALRLARLQRFMFAFDPLQHHGWFVLTEADLSEYCEAYLPAATLARGKSLLPRPARLTLSLRPGLYEARSNLERLAADVIRQATQAPPRNLYEAKSFLSQLMLLPALYLHARDGVGCSKKESFERARPEFSDRAWSGIEQASAIRLDWAAPENASYVRLQAAVPALRGQIAKRLAPGLSPALRKRLTGGFFDAAARLASKMLERLGRPSPPARAAGCPGSGKPVRRAEERDRRVPA